jgi:hypothetical protein
VKSATRLTVSILNSRLNFRLVIFILQFLGRSYLHVHETGSSSVLFFCEDLNSRHTGTCDAVRRGHPHPQQGRVWGVAHSMTDHSAAAYIRRVRAETCAAAILHQMVRNSPNRATIDGMSLRLCSVTKLRLAGTLRVGLIAKPAT